MDFWLQKLTGSAKYYPGDFELSSQSPPELKTDTPEELVATVIRFVTSIVVVPVQRLFANPLPADGEETCLEAWLEPRE